MGFLTLIEVVAASNAAVGLQDASGSSLDVPRWLYVTTGGATIGVSALLASFVTDRAFIRRVHGWRRDLTADRAPRTAVTVLRAFALVVLGLVVYWGIAGPQVPTVNFAIVFVFVGLRAGLTMATYLLGNVWPALNPWRALTERLPHGFVEYPRRVGRWPAVAGLLALVWVETTTGVTTRPAALAWAIVGYSILTMVGALAFGPRPWFENADPIAVLFRLYGQVALLVRDERGLSLRLPGMRLVEDGVVDGFDDIAFVIALVWELTFSGFVTTTVGVAFVNAFVDVGLPPIAVYLALFLGGYAAFLAAYVAASRVAVRSIATYLTAETLALRFAPSILAIAAGYHLAHYFGFFVSLSPSLAAALVSPFQPPSNPLVLTLPGWFGALGIAFVLMGHFLAVWVTHSAAYDLFPSRLQAIRSQYPFVAVMIAYTAISLWLISLPTASPAYF
ncbi:hypothetical protein [Halegenticoccus tardaugens]|uniref:hypothetical protein n=1 Tax=Halegenticoccus tardaugens TaxID=2071624 RepID=UPI001E4C8BE5|nr:hypothetical protein [Halegenticoccus tardaugens]